jgi:hypothetical protein
MDKNSHTEPPSAPTLRIKALESLLVEKGLVDPGAVDEIMARATAPRWWRMPGRIPLTKSVSWKTAARR